MKKSIAILAITVCLALLLAGCGVSREKLEEQGIFTELYSPQLLAQRIEQAVLSGESEFSMVYYGSIEDLEDLADMTWNTGYVNERYVDYIEAEYEEFNGYVTADYTLHTMEEEMLRPMAGEDGALKVYTADRQGIDLCMTDMMERRAEQARYLVKSTLPAEELYAGLNEILYDYQNNSYLYPYLVDSLSWTITPYGEMTELELAPVYREGAGDAALLPHVTTVEEYIDTVCAIWNQNMGGAADVVMEGLELTEDEIFAALMIAEANAALIPCEADEVSYMQYFGYDGKYVLSASLSLIFTGEDMAPLQQELAGEIAKTAEAIMTEHADDEERYRAAYRAVMRAAEYSDDIADATEDETITEHMRILRSAYGALVEGETVCTGYAKAYKALCDEMGLHCLMINGTQDDVGHAWNMVMLEGTPYYVDCTYGDTGGGSGYCLFSREKLESRDYVIDEEYSIYGLA